MSVPEGHGFVTGRGTATAVRLLAAADALGYEPDVVRAVSEGYHVPDDVLEEYNAHLDDEDEAISTEVDPYSLDPVYTGGDGPWLPEVVKVKGKKNQPSTDAPDTTLTGEENIISAEDSERLTQEAQDRINEASKSPEGEDPADPAEGEDPAEVTEVETPAGNASKDAWLDFAKTQPNYDESTDADLGRDELKAKFAPAE